MLVATKGLSLAAATKGQLSMHCKWGRHTDFYYRTIPTSPVMWKWILGARKGGLEVKIPIRRCL